MKKSNLLAATAAVLLSVSWAQASLVNWTIDSAQTSLSLSLADTAVTIPEFIGATGTIRVRNQTGTSSVWNNGNKAFLQGTFNTQYQDGSSIQFLLGDDTMSGINSGNYRPNPAAFNAANTSTTNPDGQFQNTSVAAAVYGFRMRASVQGPINTVDLAAVNLYNVQVNVGSSGVLALSGSLPSGLTFASSGVDTLGIASASMGVDGTGDILHTQPFPDQNAAAVANLTAGNGAAGLSSITAPNPIGQPNLRQLTIPFQVTTSLVVGGFSLPLTMTGTLVATANVPEPSTLLMAGMGLAALGAVARRIARVVRLSASDDCNR